MDIQYESTPPQKQKLRYQFSTPQHKTTPKDTDTPRKNRETFYDESEETYLNIQTNFGTPVKQKVSYMMQTPPRKGQNPQSRKSKKTAKLSGSKFSSPVDMLSYSSNKKPISEFTLSRLEEDFSFIKNLGVGNFSRVGLYQSRYTNQLFAIKITKASLMSVNEVQALGTLAIFGEKSQNIIRYYHSWIEENDLHIVMEYCGNSLTNFYREVKFQTQKRYVEESIIKDYLRQSLLGLQCMHEHNMVHLDIKPDNLLLKQNKILKISDLGLCRITRIKKWSDLDEGDSRYLAKEVLNYQQGIDLTKSDVFSLGMSFYQAIILENLPNNGQKWMEIRDQGLHLVQYQSNYVAYQHYSKKLLQILQQMTRPNWWQRPSCKQILQNHYFSQSVISKRLSRLMRYKNPLMSGQNSRKKQSSL